MPLRNLPATCLTNKHCKRDVLWPDDHELIRTLLAEHHRYLGIHVRQDLRVEQQRLVRVEARTRGVVRREALLQEVAELLGERRRDHVPQLRGAEMQIVDAT